MDKDRAIEIVHKYDAVELIDILLSNGSKELAMDIIRDCWGDTNEDVATYIEEHWTV